MIMIMMMMGVVAKDKPLEKQISIEGSLNCELVRLEMATDFPPIFTYNNNS